MLVMLSAVSQEATPKKKKKAAAKRTEVKSHQKPTPEQIRRFNELQKKQQKAQ
jgi:hypothetical protein